MELAKEKRALFVLLILSEGKFFKICALSQWIDYWIHFQNLNTFTYQKTLLHILLLLVSKIVESFQCILNAKSLRKFYLPSLWKSCHSAEFLSRRISDLKISLAPTHLSLRKCHTEPQNFVIWLFFGQILLKEYDTVSIRHITNLCFLK